MKIGILKMGDDAARVRMSGSHAFHAWTSVDLTVVAEDFRGFWTHPSAPVDPVSAVCTLSADSVEYAACTLVQDPLRRPVRTGSLVLGDASHAEALDAFVESALSQAGTGDRVGLREGVQVSAPMRLSVRVGQTVVIDAEVPVVVSPRAVAAGDGGGSAPVAVGATGDLWTAVDLGSHASFGQSISYGPDGGRALALVVPDRCAAKATLNLATLAASAPFALHIVPVDSAGAVVTSGAYESLLMLMLSGDGSATRAGSFSSSGVAGRDEAAIAAVRVGRMLPPQAAGVIDGCQPSVKGDWGPDWLASPASTFILHLVRMPFDASWRMSMEVVGAAGSVLEGEDGTFYLPAGERDGVPVYRKFSIVEDGDGGDTTSLSDARYVRDSAGRYVEVSA